MKELFRENNLIRVNFYKDLLEADGIPCLIRNEHLAYSGLTEIPIPDFFPALNVVHDEDHPRAAELIRLHLQSLQEATAEAETSCPSCGETNPGHFGQCWSCDHRLSADY